jgi:SGNH hydrolase-like domain, acetyltransferase AlgX
MEGPSPQADREGGEPDKPDHSLPSYNEPTPETHRKISREEEAELALNRTIFSRGAKLLLIGGFLATICAVPLVQLSSELRTARTGGNLPIFGILKALPGWDEIRAVRSAADLWNLLPRRQELKAAEKGLEDQSVISQWLLPRVQTVLTGALGAGNEQAWVGRDGWLFYRPDVEYVTGPAFLDPAGMKRRAEKSGLRPDPISAIVDFRDQLRSRGVELMILPVPVKPSIDGEMLAKDATNGGALQNASFAAFVERLGKEGVGIFDSSHLLMERKRSLGGQPLYLQTDTHWRPETMEAVAQALASVLTAPGALAGISDAPLPSAALRVFEKEVSGLGDIATMLRLPNSQHIFPLQTVTIHQVALDTGLWRAGKDSDVLLLGDSFSNIFSLEAMGWGESAGFAEHLCRALGHRTIDCIVRNSDGAFATREILSQELARGRDRLAGKKLVVWEFAARELAFGDWKLLPMKIGHPALAESFSLKPGEQATVTATVEAASQIPRPGAVPYKDHIFSLHLVDIADPRHPETTGAHALVYLWSMRDNVWTPAARLRAGDKVTIRLRSWDDVSTDYEKFNRSEIDDAELQKEEPLWGELAR